MIIRAMLNSQFAQGIWASLCGLFATLSVYTLYILILLLGIALMLGAIGMRSVGRTTNSFLNGLMNIVRTIIVFIAVRCVWRFIRWIARQIRRLWNWLQKNLQEKLQKYVAAGPAKVLSSIFATLIIIACILII